MTPVITTVLLLLAGFLALGVWVSFSLFAVGIGALTIFRDMPVDRILSQSFWEFPPPVRSCWRCRVFILMAGDPASRTRLAVEAVRLGSHMVPANLPGGMAHVNVLEMFALLCRGGTAFVGVRPPSSVGRITLRTCSRARFGQALLDGITRRPARYTVSLIRQAVIH